MLSGHSLADGSGRLLAIDPQICELLHLPERELVGRTYDSITHPDDRTRNVNLVERLRVGDGPLEFRKRYIRPDGTSVSATVKVSRLGGRDRASLLGTIVELAPVAARGVSDRWRTAQSAAASLRRRRAELGPELFGDMAFALLLEIYVAEAEGRLTGVPDLVDRVDASPSIVLRWVRVLVARGLVDATADLAGCAQLTTVGTRKVEHLLDGGATI